MPHAHATCPCTPGACGAFPYPAFGNYFEVVKRIVDGPLPTEDPEVQVVRGK